MKTKLTLFVEERTKRKARILSDRRRISISRLFDEFVERESARKKEEVPFEGLWGIWVDRDITLEKIREKAWRKYGSTPMCSSA
ncbi:MAG: hypothetical protein IT228_07915 [Flavobacteriales bacterium]|nr:hypothetical protein [Flavobacteriales bacterium]